MRQLGVHVQEGYPCFLTTAHSDADIAAIEEAFKATLDALEEGGIVETMAGTAGSAAATASESEQRGWNRPELAGRAHVPLRLTHALLFGQNGRQLPRVPYDFARRIILLAEVMGQVPPGTAARAYAA